MIDKFSKFGRTFFLKIKSAQTKKDSFENIFIYPERKPNSIETDRGKEPCNNIFQSFLNINNIKHFF